MRVDNLQELKNQLVDSGYNCYDAGAEYGRALILNYSKRQLYSIQKKLYSKYSNVYIYYNNKKDCGYIEISN